MIKTIQKTYLQFQKVTMANRKTFTYAVETKDSGTYLGVVNFSNAWRKYVFRPTPDTVFDKKCLLELIEFLDSLSKDRRHRNEQTLLHD